MVAPRLTKKDVHAACAEIAELGEQPTALKLLQKLGRGSLTTITKFLNSWNSTEDLNAGMTYKDIDPSKHVIELEKLRVLYDLLLSDLNAIKIELQASNKARLEAEKLVANLEGQLTAYKSLKPSEDNVQQPRRKGPIILKNPKLTFRA